MKFVIATSQRSGSVLLERSIGSHPDAHCYGELLLGIGGFRDAAIPEVIRRRRRQRHYYSMIRTGAAVQPARHVRKAFEERTEAAVGFRLMHSHARPTVIRYLHSLDARVIFLGRRNLLRQVVSRQIMHQRQRAIGIGSAHSDSGAFTETVHLEPGQVVRDMDRLVEGEQRSRKSLAGLPSIDLTYEDLMGTDGLLDTATNDLICDFLDIDNIQLHADLVRTGGQSLKDSVVNFDEVAAAIAASEHGAVLELL